MESDALRRTLILASAFNEGDRAVGGSADPAVRRDARAALLHVRSATSTAPRSSTTV